MTCGKLSEMNKKLLALDVGAKIIGVATSAGSVAFPQEEIRWGGDRSILRRALGAFGTLTEVIVGKPREPSTAMAEALATVREELEARGARVILVDEHVSTQEAANRIAEVEEETGVRYAASRRDSVAAQIILERYLGAHA